VGRACVFADADEQRQAWRHVVRRGPEKAGGVRGDGEDDKDGFGSSLIGVTKTFKGNQLRTSQNPDRECTFMLEPAPTLGRIVLLIPKERFRRVVGLYELRGDKEEGEDLLRPHLAP
jgi:hypothetical protein